MHVKKLVLTTVFLLINSLNVLAEGEYDAALLEVTAKFQSMGVLSASQVETIKEGLGAGFTPLIYTWSMDGDIETIQRATDLIPAEAHAVCQNGSITITDDNRSQAILELLHEQLRHTCKYKQEKEALELEKKQKLDRADRDHMDRARNDRIEALIAEGKTPETAEFLVDVAY